MIVFAIHQHGWPQVYMCPPHPETPLTSLITLSLWYVQNTGPGCPASCIDLALVICFT